MDDRAYYIDTEIPEETLSELAQAVEELDRLGMMIDGKIMSVEEERDIHDVLARATEYLHWLYDRIEQDDLVHVSTMPISENQVRGRIARVLKSSMQAVQA